MQESRRGFGGTMYLERSCDQNLIIIKPAQTRGDYTGINMSQNGKLLFVHISPSRLTSEYYLNEQRTNNQKTDRNWDTKRTRNSPEWPIRFWIHVPLNCGLQWSWRHSWTGNTMIPVTFLNPSPSLHERIPSNYAPYNGTSWPLFQDVDQYRGSLYCNVLDYSTQ